MTDHHDGEIIGFRQWRLAGGDQLHSMYIPHCWQPGDIVAECFDQTTCHAAPASQCGCGFYGFHEPTYAYNPIDTRVISGLISAWGVVEAHRTGFRAEYARVVALAMPSPSLCDPVWFTNTAKRYGVPLVAGSELANIATEFGSPLPVELRTTGDDAAPYWSIPSPVYSFTVTPPGQPPAPPGP